MNQSLGRLYNQAHQSHPFDLIIGLEVHIQLATDTKLFCPCPLSFGALPNENTCPVCLGLPGALPVLNTKAVDFAIAMALAIGASIESKSIFARKQYFYPDLPKGYQITQYDLPYCRGGCLILSDEKVIEVERIHMEEDAGKNIHGNVLSFIDLNRAGTPLLELVTKPVMTSAKEASEFLRKVRVIARYLGISDGNLEEGSLRCDANVSLKPKGSKVLGVRTEIKNLNSFRNVERAIEYEAARQADLLSSGGQVIQQTLRFDAEKGITSPTRSKEQMADYRYFPDPDLGSLDIQKQRIEKVCGCLPELPDQLFKRYEETLDISREDIRLIAEDKLISDYFDQVLSAYKGANTRQLAHFFITEVLREAKLSEENPVEFQVASEELAKLMELVDSGAISGKIAKSVFKEMLVTTKKAADIIADQGLTQISDQKVVSDLLDQVLKGSQSQLDQYFSGKEKILGYFVGQVMKLSGGKLNPQMVNELLKEKLNGLRKQR